MNSKNMKAIGKDKKTLASRSTEARVLIPIISLSEQVLSGITVVQQGCLAESRGRNKVLVVTSENAGFNPRHRSHGG